MRGRRYGTVQLFLVNNKYLKPRIGGALERIRKGRLGPRKLCGGLCMASKELVDISRALFSIRSGPKRAVGWVAVGPRQGAFSLQ